MCHFSDFPVLWENGGPSLSISTDWRMLTLEEGLLAFCREFNTMMPQTQLPAFFSLLIGVPQAIRFIN